MTSDRSSARAAWMAHPNIAGPASTLLMIHDQFRVAADRLALMASRASDLGYLARAFRPLAETLHHHHHAEEEMLFPLVEKRSGTAPSHLVSDHHELTAAIDAVTQSPDPASIATFRRVLVEHLDREEDLVIPLLLELSPMEAWSLIHG